MTDATLQHFRALASAMQPGSTDWQWIGRYKSQRMFGITESRARDYAERFGGEARKMEDVVGRRLAQGEEVAELQDRQKSALPTIIVDTLCHSPSSESHKPFNDNKTRLGT